MVHYEEHEDGLHVHISRKTVAALLLTLLTAVFSAIGYPVVSMVTTARHDPFTGSQGMALNKRITKLEEWRESHTRFGWERTIVNEQRFSSIDERIKSLENK